MLSFAELIFGFVPDTYSIDEAEKEVVFSVSLINGTLTRDVVIRFFTEDGTAICKIEYTHVISLGHIPDFLQSRAHLMQFKLTSNYPPIQLHFVFSAL